MKNLLDAVRGFFEERNRAWVTGDVSPVLAVAQARHGAGTQDLEHAVILKQRAAAWRRSRILRAHTRIRVRRVENNPQGDDARINAEEVVSWVYRDGTEYGVESRVIHHHQHWVLRNGEWVLQSGAESCERQGARGLQPAALVLTPEQDCPRGADPMGVRCTRYDRVRVQRYAELWWNGCNPEFAVFDPDGINFVSQCLFAGNLPMQSGRKDRGWWYHFGFRARPDAWSDSWPAAHALFTFLTEEAGARWLRSARDLKVGDIIFYDWTGERTFTHAAVVCDFDTRGEPLVNAHSDASYHRHYLYLDSRAWTPKTRYACLHLPDEIR